MQILVNERRANIQMTGDIPEEVITVIKKTFKKVKIYDSNGEELVIATESDWFKKMNSETTAGEVIKIYRENRGWSQQELGSKIGHSRQYVSDLENGRRKLSVFVAKKLASIFNLSLERLLR